MQGFEPLPAQVDGEVLAVDYGPGAPAPGGSAHADAELGLEFWISRA